MVFQNTVDQVLGRRMVIVEGAWRRLRLFGFAQVAAPRDMEPAVGVGVRQQLFALRDDRGAIAGSKDQVTLCAEDLQAATTTPQSTTPTFTCFLRVFVITVCS